MNWVGVLNILRTLLEIIAGCISAVFILFMCLCALVGVSYVILYVVNFILKPFHYEIKPEHIFKLIFYPFELLNKIWKSRKRIIDYIMIGAMGCLFLVFLGLCMHHCYGNHSDNKSEEDIEDVLDDAPPRGVPSRYW